MLMLTQDNHQFISTNDALDYAYWCEARRKSPKLSKVVPISTEKERPNWYSRTRYLTIEETITDGIMIKNTAIREIDKKLYRQHRYAIGITYRRRTDKTLSLIKDYELEQLAKYIMKINPRIKNKWYIVFILKRLVGDRVPGHQDEKFWTERTGRKSRTLRYWRNGEYGIEKIYRSLYSQALAAISIKFHDLQLVEG